MIKALMDTSFDPKPQLTVQVLETFSQFEQLKQEWDALADECVDAVFLTHEWLRTWWVHYGSSLDLLVWTARHEDRLVGVLPLVGQKIGLGLRRLLWMGFGEVTPNHLNPILHPQFEEICLPPMIAFLSQVGRKYAYMDLDKVPPDTRFYTEFNKCLKDAGYHVLQKDISYCPYLEAVDFETYFQDRKMKVRSNFRRNQRRLEKDLPSVSYRRVEKAEEVENALSTLIEMHQARFNQKGFNGAFFSQKMRSFHHAFSQQALHSGMLRTYLLCLGDQPIAVRYAFRVGTQLQYYLDSFDDQYKTYGPGILLLGYSIQQSLEEGIFKIDFLEGDEPYKSDWSTNVRENKRLRAYSSHFLGRLVKTYHAIENALSGLALRGLPVAVRRPIYQLLRRWNLIKE